MAQKLEKSHTKVCTVDGWYNIAASEFEQLSALLTDESKKLPRFIEVEGMYGEAILIKSASIEGLVEVTQTVIDASQTQGSWND